MDKRELGKRMQRLRKSAGISQAEFAVSLGLERSTVSHYERGAQMPNQVTMSRICNVLNTSSDYLLQRTDTPHPLPPAAAGEPDLVAVPEIGEISAGGLTLARERIMGYVSLPRTEVSDGSYFVLRVNGDSMVGAGIKPGDRVLVRQQAYAESGDVVVVMVGDEDCTLKRIYLSADQVFLHADNPSYAPQVYSRADVKICGVVTLGLIRP